jgi:hypothetical protein
MVIKDDCLWEWTPIDTFHDFAKAAVENSEVARRSASLQQRLTKLQQWALCTSQRSHQAGKRDRLQKRLKSRADELYRKWGRCQTTLELQEVTDHMLRREIKERKLSLMLNKSRYGLKSSNLAM